jgi:exodeoxyribonuclease VII large subunit
MREVDPPLDAEKVYSISEITSSLKDLVEAQFPSVWVTGEVSNCSLHSSGHTYFTLKDHSSQLRCVLFAGSARRLSVRPEDGLRMLARGRLTVYERQGQYELIVSTVLPAGKGDLHIAFGKLKEKLEREGLFDMARKRPLPRFPARVAVVTSPTGAAIRDIVRVATGIHAGVGLVVYPVRVQGEGAKGEITRAIDDINEIGGFDIILVTRGGGSMEDLWAFNEEAVARAIGRSSIPVVSAVGHEIDFTISDFVADARAATPSAAPSLILQGYADARPQLASSIQRATSTLLRRLETHRAFLASLETRYGLRRMRDRVVERIRDLDEAMLKIDRAIKGKLERERGRLDSLVGRVNALSPLATLERGYSICFKIDTSEIVTDSRQVAVDDGLRVRFCRGAAVARVEDLEEA